MRNLIISTAALIVALAACGPSNQELSGAKTARYHGDKATLFAATKAAVESKYKLEKVDESTLGMQTAGRWYTPEGLAASERDMRDVPDKSLNIVLVVTLLPDGDNWVVQVRPEMIRYFAGRPNPDKVEPNDPSVPGWATGKVDQLQFDVYAALKQWEVKSPGGVMPAAGAAPAGAPPAPTPATTPAPQ